jgi:hypothetical protein
MSNTATDAQPSVAPVATANSINIHVEEGLRNLKALREQIKVMQEQHDLAQNELVAILDESFEGEFRVPRVGVHPHSHAVVVRQMRRIIDQPRALKALIRRRLYKQLTKVVVDEPSYLKLVESGIFPDLSAAVRKEPSKPYIRFS